MRARELFERAAPQYYIHATSAEALPSILKKGLIPNASNNGEGNYSDTRWLSLNGVYATKDHQVAASNIHANHSFNHYGLILLAVAPNATLPDEDVIEILFKHAYSDTMGYWGIDSYYYDYVGEWFETRNDNPDDDYDDDNEPDDRSEEDFWKDVMTRFHEIAREKSDPRPIDAELLDHALDYWRDFELDGAGDTDPDEWQMIKDKLTRRYPKMAHPTAGKGWSVRIPHAVGYSGRTRIVAVLEIKDRHTKVLYGSIPPEAERLVANLT